MASQRNILLPVLICAVIFIISIISTLPPVEAVRPLDPDGEWRAMKEYGRAHALVLEMSLPKGDPKHSQASGCTYVPGTGGRPCSIKSKNIAGARSRPTPSHDKITRLRSDSARQNNLGHQHQPL